MADNFTITPGAGVTLATKDNGGVHTQKILTVNSNFQDISLGGGGYSSSTETTIPSAIETDWLVFKNTDATKIMRLWEQVASIPDSASTVRSILRVYKNPIFSLGTVLTPGGLRNGQVASICQVILLPTVSSRGTKVQVYGLINSPTTRYLDLCRYIEPGDSVLITVDCSAAGELHAFNHAWAEVLPS